MTVKNIGDFFVTVIQNKYWNISKRALILDKNEEILH